MKVLMVCLGNICRSPLAEGILQHLAQEAGLNWEIDSAGTNGYHDGEAPHHLSTKVAKLHGIDISRQVSRKFTKEDVAKYDLIYAMATDVLYDIQRIAGKPVDDKQVKLFLEDSLGQYKDVPDPWYGTEPGYHQVYDLLHQGCSAIINKYAQ